MKIIRNVATIEVKRAFVISNFSKVKGNQKGLSEEVFAKSFEKAKVKILKMSESELDKYIDWDKRLAAYNNSIWSIAEVSPNEVGVWRRASGMPLKWTNKSLVETSEKVAKALSNNSELLKKRSRYAIYNMLNSKNQLSQKDKYSLPILFIGGTGTRGRSYLRTKTKFDIDDGCMRSIAMTIKGKKTLLVYFGVSK